MAGKTRILLLLFGISFSVLTQAQNFTRHNWYFSNNDQALIFGKSSNAEAFLEDGKISQANVGEKLTATDPTTGDLLFYSNGINIFDATHANISNGSGITSDPNGIQAMAVSPIPGMDGFYYVFTRNVAGEILYTAIDMNQQGNRVNGPPAGAVVAGETNQATGITNRGDGMITIANSDMSQFWLVTQNSSNGNFEIHEIPTLGTPFDPAGAPTDLDVNIQAAHLSLNPEGTQLAIMPKNNVNIQILDFNRDSPELMFNRSVASSFVASQSLAGSIGWSNDGTKLYFSRNSGSSGNLYRIDLSDEFATVEPVFNTPLGASQSIMLAPDSSLYHIYRETNSGPRMLGRINQPDSALTSLDYETALFEGFNPSSNYFQQFTPAAYIGPTVTIAENGDYCMNNPVQFYVSIDPSGSIPTSYFWEVQPFGLTSAQQAPIFTFEEAGFYTATLQVEFEGGMTMTSNTLMGEIKENDIQVSLQDTTICPGETLTLNAEPQSSGQGQQGGASGRPYTYRWSTGETTATIDVSDAGTYWVVITPSTGCPIYESAEVKVYGDENPTANIWYFGNGAGIDFNQIDGLDPPPRSITDAHAMNAPEGTSTISDANGNVLFYSDGVSVWNSENGVMPNGTDIGGDSTSTQSVIIVPFAEDNTLYYVFTTQEIYGSNEFMLKYSVIDIKEDDGLGDVISKDNVLFSKSTEKVAALEGGNGFWLLAHEYGTNSFRAYAVTEEGISPPVISSGGSVHSINDALSGQGGMKFSGDGSRVAVALIEGSEDYVELFSFDQTTGELTFEYQIDLAEGGPNLSDQVYDVHFSPGGDKIFATMNNRNGGSAGGRILEYRIDSASTDESRLASKTNIANNAGVNVNYGAIQTGPDGQLYVAVETPGNPSGSAFIGSIAANEDTAATSSFTAMRVALTVGNSRLGLPNFVQNNVNPPQPPSMTAPDTTCVEERIELSGVGTSDIDEFLWTIVDDANNTVFNALGQDTAYVFPQGQAGRFNIALNISNRCGFDTTLVQTIDVFDIPPRPAVPTAVVMCEGASYDLDALGGDPDDASLRYEWRNSQGTVVGTSRYYTITEEEIYTITIRSIAGGGCISSADIYAAPPFEIELPESASICEGEELTLDPNVNADNYIWSRINPDNSTSTLGTERTQAVDSSTPGVYTYIVSIEDPISAGCFANDSTVLTINGSPNVSLVSSQDATCPQVGPTPDGEFVFNIGGSSNYSYTVRDASGTTVEQNNSVDGPSDFTVSSLDGGIYSVTVTDNSTNCTDELTDIEIENNNFEINEPVTTTAASCDTEDGTITISLDDPAVFPVNYVLTRTEPGFTPRSVAGVVANDFLIENLPGGTYSIEVTSTVSGCTATATDIVVDQPDEVQNLQINGVTEVCDINPSTMLTAISDDGTDYEWITPSGNVISGATITADESGTYTVTAEAPGTACPTSESVIVTLTVRPDVDVQQVSGDPCEGSVVLEAIIQNENPNARYNFNWSTGETSRRITVTSTGDYSVTVREAGDLTCEGIDNLAVTIPEELEAVLTSGPACDDGSPITLTVDVLSGTPTSYTWTRDGQVVGNTSVPSFQTSEEGSYTVEISNGTCSIERSILIRRETVREGLLPETDYYCATGTTNPILLAGYGFTSYEWTKNGQPYADAGQYLEVKGPGIYEVTMTTATGCVRIDQVEIIESCDPQILAPNVIVPEGTAPNNVFSVVPNAFVADFEVFIYNRWGELIYQSNVIDFQWDGTFNGKIVPIGTYPYVMKFTSRYEPSRGQFEQRGAITVLR